MYYQLHDAVSEEILGSVRVTNHKECLDKKICYSTEVSESWDAFNRCEEHYFDNSCVDDFEEWHNKNRVSQIERIYLEYCQP